MKNKRLIILLVLLVAAIAFFFYEICEEKILPIKLYADKIEGITISSDYLSEESNKNIILDSKEDAETIAKIAEIFNKSVKHRDQGAGTTHPTCVKIKYANDKEVLFWCGVGDFITVSNGKRQYNYVNGELDEYIAKLLK